MRMTPSPGDAEQLLDIVDRQAKRLVDERWEDICFISNALAKLGDEMIKEDCEALLRDVHIEPIDGVRYRAAPFPACVAMRRESDPRDVYRRIDGWTR